MKLPILALALLPTLASAQSYECVEMLARGDVLAQEFLRRNLPGYTFPEDTLPRQEVVDKVLDQGVRNADPIALATYGWWQRAEDFGCDLSIGMVEYGN